MSSGRLGLPDSTDGQTGQGRYVTKEMRDHDPSRVSLEKEQQNVSKTDSVNWGRSRELRENWASQRC